MSEVEREQAQEQATLYREALLGQIARTLCLLPEAMLIKVERDFDADLLEREIYAGRLGVAEGIASTEPDHNIVYHAQLGRVLGKINYFCDLEALDKIAGRLMADLKESGIILDGGDDGDDES